MISPKLLVEKARLRRHGLMPHMRVFSHTTAAERLTLFEIARSLPHGARALEIGSHIGSSALFISAGLARCGGSLICVDTWHNDAMPDGMKDTWQEFTSNTAPFAHVITPVRKRSNQLTSEDIGRPLDMMFIDGDHSEPAVRGDFQLATGSVKLGGFVAFHDLRTNYPGVGVVVGEAMAGREWELVQMVDALAVIRRLK